MLTSGLTPVHALVFCVIIYGMPVAVKMRLTLGPALAFDEGLGRIESLLLLGLLIELRYVVNVSLNEILISAPR